MKKLVTALHLVLFCFTVNAQEEPSSFPSVNWPQFLSEVEKREIATLLIRSHLENGTLRNTLRSSGQVSGSFKRIGPSTEGAATQSIIGGGTPTGVLDCTPWSTEIPHAGAGSSGTEVKAKTKGQCKYVHTGPGPEPTTMGWGLLQTLWQGDDPVAPIASKGYSKTGKSVGWSRTNTQIFTGSCDTDDYSHIDVMFVYPPPGWYWTGGNPFLVGTPIENYVVCP